MSKLLAELTSFRIGGPADLLLGWVEDEDELGGRDGGGQPRAHPGHSASAREPICS